MKIAILGGSFNPVHLGHIELCRRMLKILPLSRVLLIPNAAPPHKDERQLGFEERVQLLRTAIKGKEGLEIDLAEQGGNVHYTYDTLKELKGKSPGDSLYFAMGMDSLSTLHTWHKGFELTQFASLAVFERRGWEEKELPPEVRDFLGTQKVLKKGDGLAGAPGTRCVIMTGEYLSEASSTKARKMLSGHYENPTPESKKALLGLLDAQVIDLILDHGWYKI